MSRKSPEGPSKHWEPGAGKAQRYIQPSLLLALKRKPSYGYELIQEIATFGFMEGPAPPGMIYRHLRDMEENGWVTSEWHTEQAGPAKRIYQLTGEGREILSFWIGYMDQQAQKLTRFIDIYEASQSET
jgi:poly-beta-hydroxybutyrate-responsive repressor